MHWKTFNVAFRYIEIHSIDFNAFVAIFMDLIVIINIFYLITTFIVEVKKKIAETNH